MYFGGFSDDAKDVAAEHADVFLTWPDTVVGSRRAPSTRCASVPTATAASLDFGLRAHVIVRETEAEAKAAAARLVSKLDDAEGAKIRGKSLDSASVGVQRQAALREAASDDGFVEEALWTGVGPGPQRRRGGHRRRSRPGRGQAPRLRGASASRRSSSPATRTRPRPSCSPATCSPSLDHARLYVGR